MDGLIDGWIYTWTEIQAARLGIPTSAVLLQGKKASKASGGSLFTWHDYTISRQAVKLFSRI